MHKLLIIIFIFFNTLYAKTLHINILDTENMSSFLEYYSHKSERFKYKDAFIAFDSRNMQYITNIEFDRNDIHKYRKKRLFTRRIEKILNIYEKKYHQKSKRYLKEHVITDEPNDLAREFQVIRKFIETYRNRYTIKVNFFGNSYLHNAYGNDFSKGIPTDGFIDSKESEFNIFPDISVPEVEFAIMFDDEPATNKNRLFRFYRKLIQKKFNSTLNTFNDTSTLDAERDLEYQDVDFRKDEVKVVGERYKSDCTEHDNTHAIYIDEKGKISITIENICRKNSIITFYHNGTSIQKDVDKNGKVKLSLDAILGQNIITYFDLNGHKKELFNQKISTANNDIKFEIDEATMTMRIHGYNPLRNNQSQVNVYYKTTGSNIYMDLKDGKFETTVPLRFGDNEFVWKDIMGKEHRKIFHINQKCSDKIDLNTTFAKEYGVAKIQLYNECREEGSIVKFYYQNRTYLSHIDKSRAKITIVLNSDINDIYYENFNGTKDKIKTIKIDNFEDLIRFIISYKDNVVVLMNIFEPNIKIDKVKSVEAIEYNNTASFQEGHLHSLDKKSKNGTIIMDEYPAINDYLSDNFIKNYRQIYVTHKSKMEKGNLYFFADYFSRHGLYFQTAPLCGERSLGGVVINYQVLENGTVESGKKFLNPSKCKENPNHAGVEPNREDTYLKFIKKVEI